MKKSTVTLSLFYFTAVMIIGVVLSFVPLYCKSLGFSSQEIAIISATFCIAEAMCSIPWSFFADRFKHPHRFFVLGLALAALASILLPFFKSFFLFAVAFFLFSMFELSIHPQADALSIKESSHGRINYGTVRAFGSVGFMFIALTGGALIEKLGINVVPILIIACVFVELASAFFIPKITHDVSHKSPSLSHIKNFVLSPPIFFFLVACFLTIASQGLYYGFFSIWLNNNGHSPFWIGVFWSVAMVAEITALWKGHILFKYFSTKTLFLVAIFASVVRWFLFGLGAFLPLVVIGQLLNAISFGVFHLAAVKYMHDNAPNNLKQTAQALYNSVAYGAGSSVGLIVVGSLVDDLGIEKLFLLSAGVAFVGFAVFLYFSKSSPKTTQN